MDERAGLSGGACAVWPPRWPGRIASQFRSTTNVAHPERFRFLSRRHSSVDRENCTGHVGRFVRSQEQGGLYHLGDRCDPTERGLGEDLVPKAFDREQFPAHVCLNVSRTNGVDPNASIGPLMRKRPRELYEAGLRRAVGCQTRAGLQRRRARDHDDCTAFLEKLWGRRSSHVVRTGEIDVGDLVPRVDVVLLRPLTNGRDTGRVDQDRWSPESRIERGDGFLARGEVSNVCRDCERALTDLVLHRSALLGRSRDEANRSALLGKSEGNASTDATSGPGNQADPPREPLCSQTRRPLGAHRMSDAGDDA